MKPTPPWDRSSWRTDFVSGSAPGWSTLSGTAGTWSGDAAQGTYKVTGVNGVSQAYKNTTAADYAIETRLRFGGYEGKVIYTEADQSQTYRLDLIAGTGVRLITPNGSQTVTMTIATNTWYSVRIEVSSSGISTWVNGALCHQNFALGGQIPNGSVGIGSYGTSHTAEFDYFLVYPVAASSTGGTPVVDDQFNDGSTSGWTVGAGSWSESGGLRQVNIGGVAWSYYSSSVSLTTYTIKTYMRFGGSEGKVYYHSANQQQEPSWRVDLMSEDRVRVLTSQGANSYYRTINANTWYLVEVEVNGSAQTINVWVDGQLCNSNVAMPATPDGWVGLGSYGTSHTTSYDYFQVYSGTRSGKLVAMPEGVPPASLPRLASFPNPFNPNTLVAYQVTVPGRVRLAVFDILGQQVKQLLDAPQAAGEYQLRWDGTDDAGHPVVSGVYLCRLVAPGGTQVRKMTVLR